LLEYLSELRTENYRESEVGCSNLEHRQQVEVDEEVYCLIL